MSGKIKIALSSCLLGHAVRYDGLDKRNDGLIKNLADVFELVAVCPEVMAGLGVPRPAVQLVKIDAKIRALGVIDPRLDVSSGIINAAKEFMQTSDGICGMILKSRSPSCGIDSAKVFDLENNVIDYDSGLFASYVKHQRSGFPIVEDDQLDEPDRVIEFCQQVHDFARQSGIAGSV